MRLCEPQPLSLGIDGGGTRSRAGIAAGDRLLASAENGPVQLATMSPRAITRNLDRLLAALPRLPAPVQGVCIGAAGAATERAGPVREWGRSHFPGAQIRVVGDVDLILARAPRPVVALVAGTGVVGVALATDGRRIVADGHGFLLGDYGGAYWAGLEGLRRGLRAEEQDRNGPGVLLRMLLDELGMLSSAELPRLISDAAVPVSRIASLAPLVCALAEEKEPIAAGVVSDAIAGLVSTVAALVRRLADESAPSVRLTGGMLNAPGVRECLQGALRDTGQFSGIAWVKDGVDGALALARESASRAAKGIGC